MYPATDELDEEDLEEEPTIQSKDDIDNMVWAMDKKRKTSFNVATPDYRQPLLPDKPFLPGVMRINCKKCNSPVWTSVEKHNSMATYLFCFLICFAGFGTCCCCLIPCCMDRCKVVQHTCTKCKNYLGEYYPK